MYTIQVSNFEEWRKNAKQLIALNIPPESIQWQIGTTGQQGLFQPEVLPHTDKPLTLNIPKSYVELAYIVSHHKENIKWNLLYQALWRITHGEKQLLHITSDPLIRQLNLFKKAISRDMHKMKAFVRFQKIMQEDEEYYIAWYKPDHNIIRLVAPFFKKRFGVMNWTIMTPSGTASWDKEKLIFSEGVSQSPSINDEVEDLWCTYYKSIFNPARIKVKAMLNEMPMRYWATMPETKLIPQLLIDAPARASQMLVENEGLSQSAKDFFSPNMNLNELRTAAASCQACSLYRCARQTVFGVGDEQSDIMIVGEQPGLQEDQVGEPFVGPAGQLLKQVVEQLDFSGFSIYYSNVVKHFKHTLVRGRQLHRSPDIREVNACKPWILREIELVKPKVVVCLGNTAARALIQPGFAMTKNHGTWYEHSHYSITATFHPAAILRALDSTQQLQMQHAMENDFEKVKLKLSGY